ncbi:MAG: glutamine-hydrolyzing GMP synthase [Promethearchaeota archaeon]|nr:MAG: glutamine-hydrolyzing GMP synthase [Candidatus Lokiarchaeota archaeon]
MKKDLVLILDFGSQLAHLISRRVRDLGVYSEIRPFNIVVSQIKEFSNIKGVILSGGPSSVYDPNAPQMKNEILDYFTSQNIPVLGLCYGHQLIAQLKGGVVRNEDNKEFGKTSLTVISPRNILEGLNPEEIVWMSHGDQVESLPEGYEVYARTNNCPIAAYGNVESKIYGLQFHPEVVHTKSGNIILSNFLFSICNAFKTWKMDDWTSQSIKEIQREVKDESVLLGLSGGVDSSVTARLLQEAIHERVHPVFVNNGLLRENEEREIVHTFKDKLHFKNFHYVDASKLFLEKLKGVIDPEEKRKIIATTFIDVFDQKAAELKENFPDITYLAQGTIYPDRVESSATSAASSKIKSHHNVILPENMKLKVIEPLRDLYKDEVRRIGKNLLPEDLVNRQPFPGPGLAVRCIGEITEENLSILKKADLIIREEIEKVPGLQETLWQYFGVFLPVKTVGVMGDARTYESVCVVRVVQSIDAMTANFAKLDWNVLESISSRIINEVRGINRVVYDISNKPPSTIEFE